MKQLVTLLTFLAAITVAHASEADLIGTYGVMEKKGLTELVKISKVDGAFVLTEKNGRGAWVQSKQTLKPISRSEFEKLLKHTLTDSFEGLGNSYVAIFKVPTSFQEGKFTAKTGYFLFFGLGPVELHKL